MQAEAKREISSEEEKYLATLPQRRALSSLLKQGKFSEAFKYAADNGVTELITNPAELKNLRGSFTKDELGKFFSSMPDDLKPLFAPPGLQDEKFNFDPQKGVEYSVGQWRGETGFPLVSSAFMAKEDKTVENLAKIAGAAMLTAGLAPGLLGGAPAGEAAAGSAAGGAGAAGAGAGTSGAVSGLKSAYQAVASIPNTIGKTVAQALGLPIEKAIAQTAFGNSLISGAMTAAKGGDIGDVIKSGLIAAGVTYGLDAAVNAVKGMMPDISNAVGSEVSNAATTSGIPTSSALDALQEIVVTAKKVSDVAGLGGAVAGAATTPSPEKSPLEEAAKPDELEEVTVTGKRVTTPPIAAKSPLEEVKEVETTKPEPEFEPAPTVDDLQEVKVTGERVPLPPVAIAPPVEPPSPIETPFEPAPTVGGEQQIEVTTKGDELDLGGLSGLSGTEWQKPEINPVTGELEVKVTTPGVDPTTGDIDLSKIGDLAGLAPGVLTEGYKDLPKDKPKTEEELDKIQKALETGTKIPGALSAADKLKEAYEAYKKIKQLAALLGGLGAASSGGKGGPPTTGKLPTGFGGALPKYEIKRTALKPDIDYYKYGYGPEALFFEDKMTQVEPSKGPDSGVVNPESEPRYAQGGLAAGGRYVDGPGSGRDDKIPALLSDGEYVIDAETLALLGDGSPKEGAKRMDKFRANIRKHKGNALSRGRISPNAKAPSKYMGGGLT
jgi:hypothetical protein